MNVTTKAVKHTPRTVINRAEMPNLISNLCEREIPERARDIYIVCWILRLISAFYIIDNR